MLTQLPRESRLEREGALAAGMLRQPFGDGARIVLVEPGGAPRVLTKAFDSACDPQLSFDGTRVLFAGKRKSGDQWNIFEMPLEGGEARQITSLMGNCRSPIYQGTLFTLDSQEPWRQIAFTSDLAGELNEFHPHPATDLFSCRLDGTELRRLTFNPSSDFDPRMLPDGRMVYSAWQPSRRQPGGRVGLFCVNIDGTDNAMFCGDEGRRVKQMPCVTRSGLVAFIEGDTTHWDGAGSLAFVTLRRNLHSYQPVRGNLGEGLFHSPSALPDGDILVSARDISGRQTTGRRGRPDRDQHAVYRVSPFSGDFEPVFDDPRYHDIQAQAVAPQPVPDGRSTVVLDSEPKGKIYGLSVFVSDIPPDRWIKPDAGLRLRVLEGLPARHAAAKARGAQSIRRGSRDELEAEVLTAGASSVRRRFLGEIRVARDGSFNLQVPANTPIQLQLVDQGGLAIRSTSWIWVKNRENRGCIGCHEDNELSPFNRFAEAFFQPSIPLCPPPEKRRTTVFRRDVAPIISAKCATAACHGGGAASLRLLTGSAANEEETYARLLSTAPDSPGKSEPPQVRSLSHRYVRPGSARTSPLVWHLLGRNTSMPWDRAGTVEEPVQQMPVGGASALTEDERLTFVEWIDLGAPLDDVGEEAVPRTDAEDGPNGGMKR